VIERRSLIAGAGASIAVRALLPRLILLKLGRDLRRLNAGDHRAILSGFAEDAVLHFKRGRTAGRASTAARRTSSGHGADRGPRREAAGAGDRPRGGVAKRGYGPMTACA
jgi:hypothetical protein